MKLALLIELQVIFLLIISSVISDMIDYCYLNCGSVKNLLCNVQYCEEDVCDENVPNYNWRFTLVDAHNQCRNRIAHGEDNRGGNTNASNMMAVTYDMVLEFAAACMLYKYGPKRHPCIVTEEFYMIGLNMWTSAFQDPSTPGIIHGIVNYWYEEIINTNKDIIENYPNYNNVDTNYSHFTQVVWATTTHIGCARCRTPDLFVIACAYGPSGNIKFHSVYESGAPASNCPGGTKPNYLWPYLCGEHHYGINSTHDGLIHNSLTSKTTSFRYSSYLYIIVKIVLQIYIAFQSM